MQEEEREGKRKKVMKEPNACKVDWIGRMTGKRKVHFHPDFHGGTGWGKIERGILKWGHWV